jgi:hypothetical protein
MATIIGLHDEAQAGDLALLLGSQGGTDSDTCRGVLRQVSGQHTAYTSRLSLLNPEILRLRQHHTAFRSFPQSPTRIRGGPFQRQVGHDATDAVTMATRDSLITGLAQPCAIDTHIRDKHASRSSVRGQV